VAASRDTGPALAEMNDADVQQQQQQQQQQQGEASC
jgi:hypothetical protein